MTNVRIALAQINSTVGDLKGNSAKILEMTKKAKAQGASLVVFPELALTGYPPEDLLLKPQFIRDNVQALKKLATYVYDTYALVSFADQERKNLYNAVALLGRGRLLGIYHKIFLPNYGVFDERRYFTPGQKQLLFSLGGIRFGVNICEDIWHPESLKQLSSQGKAQVVLNVNASPYHVQKWKLREKTIIPQIHADKCAVCYINMVGGQDEIVFDGGSMVFHAEGKVIARAKQFQEDLLLIDTDTLGLSSPKGLAHIAALELKLPKSSLATLPKASIKTLDPLEEIYEALVLGTRDYMGKNNFKKAVIGLSGGIDSSLTAAIAVDALGPQNVVGVLMPSPYTSPESVEDAEALAKNLRISFMALPITPLMESYQKVLAQEFQGLPSNIAEENIQARIRGNLLMALSNKFGWLVLTTGNKSELSVGYATLYGDMAGGFAVIKDVFKTLVYKLSDWHNKKSRMELIPKRVFTKAPTAELKAHQTDQDTLPPYEILDAILQAYVVEDKGVAEMVRMGLKEPIIRQVIAMVDKAEYKRRQAPPGIKITPKAFGRDRRMPITNAYKPALSLHQIRGQA